MHIFHRYRPVAVQHALMSVQENELGYSILKDGVGLHRTRILLRCWNCPKVKVNTVPGHWTLEEVKEADARLSDR